MLLARLHLDETRSYGRAWLKKINTRVFTLPGLRNTFVLVTPNHQVEEIWDDVVLNTLPHWSSDESTFKFVLMNH